MSEARTTNMLLLGMFIIMLCVYVTILQYSGADVIETSITVSAFCG